MVRLSVVGPSRLCRFCGALVRECPGKPVSQSTIDNVSHKRFPIELELPGKTSSTGLIIASMQVVSISVLWTVSSSLKKGC
jgi:hypothetical protein